jgi:hypothetical protein
MQGAGRILVFVLGLLLGLAPMTGAANAQSTDRPIVLAQQERPSIFRHLFRRRGREVPMTPQLERRLQQRQQQLIRPAQPQPELARPTRKSKEEARPKRKREQARPAKRRESAKSRRQREQSKPRADAKPQQAKPRKERRIGPAAAVPKPVQAAEKAADAKKVLVLGDFTAGQMAKGLTEAYVEHSGVVVIDANRGDSGLVRADLFDWPKELPALVMQHSPDAIVMMLGANDRQSISDQAGRQEIGSEGWRAAYGARVLALAAALKATGKPVFWAGLAPVRSGQMSRDYSAMNGIFREQAEREGLRFVDPWPGFADEEGKFVSTGPDISGKSVQLRTGDLGINFTRAGQRKLAFFVESDLNATLGGGGLGVAGAMVPAAGLEVLAGPPPELVREGVPVPTIGPMVPIEALAAGGDALSGPSGAAGGNGTASDAVLQRLAAEGSLAPAGRADNFAQASVAAPVTPPAPEVPAAPPPPTAPAAPPPPAPSPAVAGSEPLAPMPTVPPTP